MKSLTTWFWLKYSLFEVERLSNWGRFGARPSWRHVQSFPDCLSQSNIAWLFLVACVESYVPEVPAVFSSFSAASISLLYLHFPSAISTVLLQGGIELGVSRSILSDFCTKSIKAPLQPEQPQRGWCFTKLLSPTGRQPRRIPRQPQGQIINQRKKKSLKHKQLLYGGPQQLFALYELFYNSKGFKFDYI